MAGDSLKVTPAFWAALLGWAALLLIALFGAQCSPATVEQRLQAASERALNEAGLGFVEVAMDGQIARLEGYGASAEEVERAQAVVLQAAGAGGPWLGGITAVSAAGLQVADPRRPYWWRATRKGAAVVIEGYAPSATARERLRASARAMFESVTDESQQQAGAPAGPSWRSVAELALAQLARLDRGEVSVIDATIVVSGEAGADAADAIRSDLGKAPAPYVAIADITAPGAAPTIAGLEGVDLRDADPDACQGAFEALLAGEAVIQFGPNDARIAPDSGPLLNSLAAVARRCDAYAIEIAGHTSAEGERDLNMSLSRERAEAVSVELVRLGVSPDRLIARGYGPDRPRATNRTPEGRAANRRIEFTVSR